MRNTLFLVLFSLLIVCQYTKGQNWEVAGCYQTIMVQGTSIGAYGNETEIQNVDVMAFVGAISGGLYLPFIKSQQNEFSFGLNADLTVGTLVGGSNVSSAYIAQAPLGLFLRYGAGSVKRSLKYFGIGFGIGESFNGFALGCDFDNTVGYAISYIKPYYAVEVTLDNWSNKIKFRYSRQLAIAQDDYYNESYDIDYGVDVSYQSIGIIFIFDFR